MRLSIPTLVALALASTTALAVPSPAAPVEARNNNGKKTPKGFVKTNGTQFSLDGKPFFFAGTNSYWVTDLESYDDAYATMKAIADAGLKVLRIWGFAAWTEVPKDPKLAWYQLFHKNGTVEYNWGANGIQRLDRTVKIAEELGLKLVWPLVNNWAGYGGMDHAYIDAFAAHSLPANATKYHSIFYTEPKLIAQYQDWVKLVVNRYKKSPAIFSWQLANEPRCLGEYPASPDCNVNTLQTWIKAQSAFIKKLDPHHLVSIGSEGFFNWKNVSSGLHNGVDGVDFDTDLEIATIDYGTYHAYPGVWTKDDDKGLFIQQWVRDHTFAQVKANKPTVLEEFGFGDNTVAGGLVNSTKWTPAVYQTIQDGNVAGVMPWQWGICGLSQRGIINYEDKIDDLGCSPNDSHTTYPGNSTYDMLLDAAKKMNAKSG